MKYIVNIRKTILYLLSPLLFLITGCSDQIDSLRIGKAGQAKITFSLKTGNMVTRAIDTNTINTLDILLFEEKTEGIYNYVETFSFSSPHTSYDIELDATDNNLKLYFLANALLNANGITIEEDDNIEDVKNKLIIDFLTSGTEPDYLPMYGESDIIPGLAKDANTNITISLLRDIASFQISLKEDVTNFELHTVQAFRANREIQLIPNSFELKTDESGEEKKIVTTPSVPENATVYNSNPIGSTTLATTTLTGLYLPESDARTGEPEKTEEATCLVIGGKYAGSDQITYYRVDIKSINGGNFGQILRNTQYNILITKVEESEYTDPTVAANNPVQSMEINVIEINDGGGEVLVDAEGNMLILEVNPVRVGYYAGAVATSSVATTASNYSIQWANAGFSGSEATIEWKKGEVNNNVLEGEYFDIRIVPDTDYNSDPTYTYSTLEVTARKLYNGEERNERSEQAIIHMGDLYLKFTITQKARTAYQYDFIDIFSYTDLYCTLGDEIMKTEATSGIEGPVLINLVKNTTMFSPTGTVPVGGFDISGLPESSSHMTPYLADIFNVIFLPLYTEYISQSSEELYKTLKGWLEDHSNHVLITPVDNFNIRNVFPINIAGDNEWWPSPLTSSGNYEVAQNAPAFILKGPFGKINPGDEVKTSIDAWGNPAATQIIYANDNIHLTPVLTMKGNSNEIVLSIDEKNRIIYYADHNWFYADSNTFSLQNNLQTPADILLANLFAWIADTVIGEKTAPDAE